ARSGDIWYLDEVVVKCAGEKFWLWRAVDQHGTVLEEILQKPRDKKGSEARAGGVNEALWLCSQTDHHR
ncbi:DDE-type integrase/transposase/recombinase, partial [Rhizobium brockwellii]